MPTLNKLEYLDETKQEIKSALNTNFNSGITDEDTFRSYVTKIDNIYTNWPKVTNEGTELTLSNVKKSKMPLEPKGNTEQTTYTGKNFAIITPKDISNYGLTINYDTNTGKISIKGKANTTAGIGVSTSPDLNVPSGYYTLSINKALPCLINYVVTDTQNTNRAFRIPVGSTNVTVNIPYDGISSGLFVAIENNVDYDLEFYLQLESGSTPTSFEPYVGGTASPNPDYPQEIEVVKGNNTIKVTGKNLLNVSNSYSVTTSQEVNINLETGTYSMSCTDITTDVTTGTSSLCNFYHSDNTFDQLYFSHTNKVGQITITAPVTKVKIYSSNSFNNSNGKTTTFTNLMIEKGSTATSYQPYQETTYPLNLGTTEVCKIGTYQDSFERDNKGIWGTNIKIGKVVLDGSESWESETAYEGYYRYNIKNLLGNLNTNNGMNDRFTQRISQGHGGYEYLYIQVDYGIIHIQILQSRLANSSVDTFKTWLSNNPVTVYYILATPTGEEIGTASTNTLAEQLEALYNAMSVDGTNIITSTYEEGNAPVIINATALMKGGN